MSPEDEYQIEVPASFVALFVPEGRIKPTAPWREIRERYEYCEDLANMLTETAGTKLWQLGVAESDVLQRIGVGLQGGPSGPAGVSEAEAQWVLRRLAELMGWSAA